MTNPLAILALHAADSYHNALISSSTSTIQNKLPKTLLYAIGTGILATVIYKSIHKNATIKQLRPYIFLYTLSFPFKYIYNFAFRKKNAITTPQNEEEVVPFEEKYFREYDEWAARTDPCTDPCTNPCTNPCTESELEPVNKVINPVEEEHRKECLENMYYSTVREKINDFYGDVIMCYDHKTFSFAYYARTGNIPYKYLETISRKYMIETNAPREIHVDIRDEYKKAKERTTTSATSATAPATSATASATSATASATSATATSATATSATATSAATTAPAPEKDVFVKLKSYNTAPNLNMHTTTKDTKEKTHQFVNEQASPAASDTSGTTKIIRDKANRYSYRGKIDDFAEHHKTFLADRRKAATADTTAPATTDTTPATTATTATTDTTAITATEIKNYAEYKNQMMKTRSAL